MAVKVDRWRAVEIGQVGVDSGILLVIDPCYIGGNFPADVERFYRSIEGGQGKISGAIIDEGLASSTADGDGVYPVYAIYLGDRHIGMLVAYEALEMPIEG